MKARNEALVILIASARAMLTSRATGGPGDEALYSRVRKVLLNDPELAPLTPRWMKSCRNLRDIWGMIKQKWGILVVVNGEK